MILWQRYPRLLSTLKEYFFITLGLALYATAWNMFVLPHKFVGGGFGGISALLYFITGIPLSAWYLALNVILVSAALRILGKVFSFKTVFGILGLIVLLAIIPEPSVPIISDRLLSAIMGGILAGIGVGSYLLHGGSTGGSDIVVLIVSKYKNLSWGKVYVLFDACVIAASWLLPGRSLEHVAYGFVFMGVSAYAIDLVHSGMRQSVQIFIFSRKYREIADQIILRHHRGTTIFDSIGWYTKQETKTIYLVARRRESNEIFRTVKGIDERAFIAVSNVMSVFGAGFDTIKAGFTKPKIGEGIQRPLDFEQEHPRPKSREREPTNGYIPPSDQISIVTQRPDVPDIVSEREAEQENALNSADNSQKP
ncbi:MAG: YitT family protein [Bradymonadales bacterium]|jgi:uncharacterized membrane-anchored protein YitT (DUF2179 family)